MVHSPLLKEMKHFLCKIEAEEKRFNSSHFVPEKKLDNHLFLTRANKMIPKIVIVGGGLAGLSCAYHLYKFGIVATIYEANNRIGGRCWTRRDAFNENQFIERGGELIDSNHKAIIGLTNELNLPLDDLLESEKANTKPLFFINNCTFTHEEVHKNFLDISDKLKRDFKLADFPTLYFHYTKHGKYLDQMSIVDWINLNVSGGIESKFGQLLCMAYTIENGAECSDQSALNLLNLLGFSDDNHFKIFGNSDERFRVQGGNDQIITKLTELLKNQIITNHQLIAIKENDNHTYTLTFNTSTSVKEVYADKVVIAVPFSILKSSVDYSKAGFKPLKELAIKELGMGNNAKLHFQFDKRFWELFDCNGTTFSNQRHVQCTFESSRAQPGDSGVLIHLSGGKNVDSIKENRPKKYTNAFLAELENMFPGCTNSFNGKKTIDLWSDYKWTKGSYSYRKVGQFTKFGGVEQEREGQCYFAGEHTSIHFSGYMNGAVESGIRAATEIIESLI